MNKKDFGSGKIVYNEFYIDFDMPFSEQLDALTEDLLQVKYEGGYLLDLGWYPEYEETGCVLVQLVKDGDWRQPIYKGKASNCEELKNNIIEAMKIVCN